MEERERGRGRADRGKTTRKHGLQRCARSDIPAQGKTGEAKIWIIVDREFRDFSSRQSAISDIKNKYNIN